MDIVEIYISGQCDPNPGAGAWAAALYFEGHQRLISGNVDQTTNQRITLIAAIEALKCLKRPCEVWIFTCDETFQRIASGIWHSDKNADLWSELEHFEADHGTIYQWVAKNTDRKLDEIRHYAMKLLIPEDAS